RISAADPLNLVGIILPGPRVPAVPSNYLIFRDGLPIRSGTMREEPHREASSSADLARGIRRQS
ncbi:MAG: hypothetical protein ACREIS_10840, partial [Nitrospiraceae bacterium]